MTPVRIQNRMKWCRKHLDWSEEKWATVSLCHGQSKIINFFAVSHDCCMLLSVQVIFSDETYVDVSGPISQYVRRTSSESIRQEHCISHKPYFQRTMFWGAFHCDGPLALVPLTGTMNATKYRAILQENLVPFLENQPLAKQFISSNAPAHTAIATTTYLSENCVEVLQWPPFSPDLNPIENLWVLSREGCEKRASATRKSFFVVLLRSGMVQR